MSLISLEYKTKCSFCNGDTDRGGFHRGFPDIALCSGCLHENAIHILGYILGDAIFDTYGATFSARIDLIPVVQKIVGTLEKEIYKALIRQEQAKHWRQGVFEKP